MLKRILLAPSAYYPSLGGVEELTRKLAGVYRQLGYQVQIVTAKPKQSRFIEKLDGITVQRFFFFTPARKLFNNLRFVLFFPWEILRLWLLAITFRPDVIHVQCNGSNTFYIYVLAWLTGIKLVDTLQGETVMDEQKIYQTSRFFPFALKKILALADYVTACSRATLEEAARYGNYPQKSAVVFNGVNLQEFNVVPQPGAATEPYIFATGRFTYNKGFDLLIQAFKILCSKRRDQKLQLIIGGEGRDKPAAEQLIKTLKLKQVVLTGRLSRAETVKYMQGALFVVMPSRYEPFGIVALEALAAGKAVLVTERGGPPEFIKANLHGYHVDPEDSDDFEKKLDRMLKNYKKLERNSLEYVKKYSWNKIAQQYIRIYQKILGAKR